MMYIFHKDVHWCGNTHKNVKGYHKKRKLKYRKDKLSPKIVCLIFVAIFYIDTNIFCVHYKENYIYLKAVLKSKPFVKVCFFYCSINQEFPHLWFKFANYKKIKFESEESIWVKKLKNNILYKLETNW